MGLLGDIIKQFEGFGNLLGRNSTSDGNFKYPDQLAGGIDKKQITNAPNYTDKSWQQSRGYAFLVVRALPGGGIETSTEDWQEFRLQINPQELTQDEIFAIEVTPTLRGVVVEHHGTVLKDISISGTTGISPLRQEAGANKNSGAPRMVSTGHSGFEEFHELRSYFRMYVEAKRLDDRARGELRMVFKNFKDQEFLFVEPQKFTMKRSANRPMLYDYQIQLKAIGNASDFGKVGNPGLSLINQIDSTIEYVQDTLDDAIAIINGSIGIVARVERNVQDALLNPLRQISIALQSIRGGAEQILGRYGITRRFVDATNAELKRVSDNLSDAFGVPMVAYNGITGRTSTLSASVGRTPTYQESKVLNAMQKVDRALLSLAAQRSLFDENVFQSGVRATSAFNGKFTLQTPNTVRPIAILGDDTIQTIAAREMGDVDGFREIVILNNLKPPYISATGGPGVLRPGDTILIPQQTSSQNTGVMQNKIYNIQRDLTEMERALGVDLQINEDGDIVISNIGDAALVGGMQNMGQAIATKLLLEIGSLKRHRGVGTNLGVGRKVRSNFLNDLQGQILTSLAQDPRVEGVPFIQINQEGGTTKINMLVKVAKIAQPVPIPLSINTG